MQFYQIDVARDGRRLVLKPLRYGNDCQYFSRCLTYFVNVCVMVMPPSCQDHAAHLSWAPPQLPVTFNCQGDPSITTAVSPSLDLLLQRRKNEMQAYQTSTFLFSLKSDVLSLRIYWCCFFTKWHYIYSLQQRVTRIWIVGRVQSIPLAAAQMVAVR